MTPDPGAAWRRATKARVAHGIVAGVWAASTAALLGMAASLADADPEAAVRAGQWLAALAAAGAVTGGVLSVLNGRALGAGVARYAALRDGAGVVAAVLTVLVVAVIVLAVLGRAASWVVPLAVFLMGALAYQLAVAGATVAALRTPVAPA